MKFAGLKSLELKMFKDQRGVFVKPFHEGLFAELGLETVFKEDFYSVSKKGVLRGFHFQIPPHDHSKLIYCSRGAVVDVALDLRVGSPSYGECFSTELTESNGRALYIPSGMAHAFLSLIDDSTVHYKVSTIHVPSHDTGILWSSVEFDWHEALGKNETIVTSERDSKFSELSDFVSPFFFSGEK